MERYRSQNRNPVAVFTRGHVLLAGRPLWGMRWSEMATWLRTNNKKLSILRNHVEKAIHGSTH
jgi:hypothetical protein